jgi:hypothetical protein
MLRSFWYDADHNYDCYADSTKKLLIPAMDSIMKKKIIVPMTGIDASYVVRFMTAHYISKQDTVGIYTPIIVRLSGDDYDETMMILLDTAGTPVSKLRLAGGECGGPDEIGDSLLLNCPVQYSYFERDRIHSYVLHVYDHVKGDGIPSLIDSVTYEGVIGTNGMIGVTRKDSTRYSRLYKW